MNRRTFIRSSAALAACITLLVLAGTEFGLAAAESTTIADLSLTLVPLQPGTFTLGNIHAKEGSDEYPPTRVTLAKAAWLGATEVTVGQWRRFTDSTGYRTEAETNHGMFVWIGGPTRFAKRAGLSWRDPGYPQDDTYPVAGISWHDAQKFCAWLTAREKAAGRLPEGYGYTLPTEAQWEYACRAGDTGPDMEKAPGDYAWFAGNSDGHAHPVATKRANAWGFYDMIGNAWEWCLDWYGKYPGGEVTDPKGPASSTAKEVIRPIRENRGNGWNSAGPGHGTSPTNRWSSPDLDLRNNLGFRVALSPAQ